MLSLSPSQCDALFKMRLRRTFRADPRVTNILETQLDVHAGDVLFINYYAGRNRRASEPSGVSHAVALN